MNSTATSKITIIRITGSAASGKTTIAKTLKDGLRGITMTLELSATLAGLQSLISHCKATPVPVYIILDDCSITEKELERLHEKMITISSSCN